MSELVTTEAFSKWNPQSRSKQIEPVSCNSDLDGTSQHTEGGKKLIRTQFVSSLGWGEYHFTCKSVTVIAQDVLVDVRSNENAHVASSLTKLVFSYVKELLISPKGRLLSTECEPVEM